MLMAATCITYRTPKNTTIQAAKTPKHYLVAETKVPMVDIAKHRNINR
jgi:Tat protein secretion system quality control protein TatD with DNase activity